MPGVGTWSKQRKKHMSARVDTERSPKKWSQPYVRDGSELVFGPQELFSSVRVRRVQAPGGATLWVAVMETGLFPDVQQQDWISCSLSDKMAETCLWWRRLWGTLLSSMNGCMCIRICWHVYISICHVLLLLIIILDSNKNSSQLWFWIQRAKWKILWQLRSLLFLD